VSVGSLASPITSDARAKMEPEDILRSAIEARPFGIVIVEPLGKIVLANGEVERMFGYAHDELVGLPVDSLVAANLRDQHARHRSQFAAHPGIRMAKCRNFFGQRKDSTEFPVEVGLNPIHTNEGTRVHLLTIARANSQRLVRLVNTILDMEKIESGKVVFVLKRVEVRALVEQAIEANRGFAAEYNVRMRLDAASAAGDVRGDLDWLLQVVTNLLSNAVKFSPPGEEVVVATERRGGTIRITVRDHGHGIPDDFKPRIFEKFAQADASDARQQGGTGLGLNIVKQIVTRLGGEVGFADAPGGGAIFHVELPGWEQATETESETDATAKYFVPPVENDDAG
jgi:PAS domain S-box-containing protein